MLFDANVAQVGPLLARGVARAGLTGFVFAVAVAKVPFDTQTAGRGARLAPQQDPLLDIALVAGVRCLAIRKLALDARALSRFGVHPAGRTFHAVSPSRGHADPVVIEFRVGDEATLRTLPLPGRRCRIGVVALRGRRAPIVLRDCAGLDAELADRTRRTRVAHARVALPGEPHRRAVPVMTRRARRRGAVPLAKAVENVFGLAGTDLHRRLVDERVHNGHRAVDVVRHRTRVISNASTHGAVSHV
mmetsp:Transcript_9775/g.25091  ORF Transcript_9775/g.25091 Transcript_9775/m.25091 type:complete len:246 (-) Transcript_9775:2844-3581(-)